MLLLILNVLMTVLDSNFLCSYCTLIQRWTWYQSYYVNIIDTAYSVLDSAVVPAPGDPTDSSNEHTILDDETIVVISKVAQIHLAAYKPGNTDIKITKYININGTVVLIRSSEQR